MDLNLEPLLNPKSIAVIGASPDAGGVGGMVLNFLLKFGYQGNIYPINPKYQRIRDLKCYPSIRDIPKGVDAVLMGIAAKYILASLQECADQGIKTAIIPTSGFAEMGSDGKKLQEELKEIIRQNGLRVCGPNCNGIVNFYTNATMCFSRFLEAEKINQGNIGFVTQSGALGGSFINRAHDRNMGFTYYIAPGNEADADVVDFMSYLVNDNNTKVIAAYVEQIRDAQKFMEVTRRAAENEKPIVILKVGATATGAKAAASHTGALAGSDRVYDVAFKQNGVIRAEDLDDLLGIAKLLSSGRRPRGNKVGVISSSGGGSIMLADLCEKHGFDMPDISESTKQELKQMLPEFATPGNPMDLTWGAFRGNTEQNMFKTFAQDENLDIIIFMQTMIAGERARLRAVSMVDATNAVDKPCMTWWAAGNLADPGFRVLDESSNVLFKSPGECIRALKGVLRYARFQQLDRNPQIEKEEFSLFSIDKNKAMEILAVKEQLTEHRAKQLLSIYGIPVTREEVVNSANQATAVAEKLGYPLAMKISSPQISHKSEAGGIQLNLTGMTAVKKAYGEIITRGKNYRPGATVEGVLIQEMVSGGVEVIIGVSKDPTFGPTIMFGLGGIYVEILKDVSLRVLPINRRDAEEMVQEIKGYEILNGARGKSKVDINAITDILLKVSKLITDFSESIEEIDLNPVIVLPEGKGAKVVDTLIVKKNK